MTERCCVTAKVHGYLTSRDQDDAENSLGMSEDNFCLSFVVDKSPDVLCVRPSY